jgi:hypothetical protein
MPQLLPPLRIPRYNILKSVLTALANQISAGGQARDGDGTPGDDYTFGDPQGLYRFYGDANADGRADVQDLGQFAQRYLTTLP